MHLGSLFFLMPKKTFIIFQEIKTKECWFIIFFIHRTCVNWQIEINLYSIRATCALISLKFDASSFLRIFTWEQIGVTGGLFFCPPLATSDLKFLLLLKFLSSPFIPPTLCDTDSYLPKYHWPRAVWRKISWIFGTTGLGRMGGALHAEY